MQRWIPLFLALIAFVGVRPAAAEQTFVVDRIVAVVDDEVVTWQRLRKRVKPYEQRRASASPTFTAQDRAALERTVLDTMVEEVLVKHAADRAHLSATNDEVDHALSLAAANNKITLAELTAAVVREGMTLAEYREQIRYQILEQRYLLSLPNDPYDPKASDAEHQKWSDRKRASALKMLREECFVEVRL
jgi:peptidyl-prolyl cis-trans isomerase SurA